MWAAFKRLKLYIVAIPTLCIVFGTALNQVVLIANHDKFPVMVNREKTRSEDQPDGLEPGDMMDRDHVVMSPTDRLKFLSDIFDLGDIYSVGDGFIELGEYGWSFAGFIWIYAICRKVQDETK